MRNIKQNFHELNLFGKTILFTNPEESHCIVLRCFSVDFFLQKSVLCSVVARLHWGKTYTRFFRMSVLPHTQCALIHWASFAIGIKGLTWPCDGHGYLTWQNSGWFVHLSQEYKCKGCKIWEMCHVMPLPSSWRTCADAFCSGWFPSLAPPCPGTVECGLPLLLHNHTVEWPLYGHGGENKKIKNIVKIKKN